MFIKIVAGLLLLNALTYFAFWRDKQSAIKQRRRIPERDLLLLCLLGGSPAGLWARHRFRHKTQKQPFSTYLWIITGLQFFLLVYVGYTGLIRPPVA